MRTKNPSHQAIPMLLLAFEHPPHPDAVCHPASPTDAQLVLDLLAMPAPERIRYADQFRNFLRQHQSQSPFTRPSVPVRHPSGLYHLVPWRLAKWLAHTLPAPTHTITNTTTRIRSWLTSSPRK